MAQNAHLLSNMGLNPDTLELAKSIMHEATVKTKPGSGYDLRHRATGLPAICAYIASHRLKTNELTRHTAQVASCLSRPDFDKAFQTIEAAIGGSRQRESKIASYQSLCRKYQVNEHALEPLFQQAQRALVMIDGRYNPDRTAEVKYGIFYWVCSLWKGKIQEIEEFAAVNKLSFKTFVVVVTTLNDKCKTLKAEIINSGKKAATSPTKSASTPSRRSPTKRPLRELPTKDSPTKKRTISPGLPDQPSQPIHKALADLVDRRPFPETPTKRRKLDDSALSSQRTPAVSATPLKSILRTSPRKDSTTSTPSRVKLAFSRPEPELSDSDAEMDTGPLPSLNLAPRKSQAEGGSDSEVEADSAEGESDVDGIAGDASPFLSRRNKHHAPSATVKAATIRRFRPVYLDYKQWNTLDPRISAIYAT